MSLKDKARSIEAAVRIGKNGLTEGTINEIKRQLKDKKLVKVKLLKPFIADKDKKNIAKELAEKTDSGVVIANKDGVLEWANEGFNRLTGYQIEEFKNVFGNNVTVITPHPELKGKSTDQIDINKSYRYDSVQNNKNGEKIFSHK